MAGRAGHTTETTTTHSTQSADGSARSTVTKTERLVQSSTDCGSVGVTYPAQPVLCASPSGTCTECLVLCHHSSYVPLPLLVLGLP